MATTSLKLSDEIKQLAVNAAKNQGVTPHAFMVEAIRCAATAANLRAKFVAEALAARSEAMESGKGFRASEVHDYIRARVQGTNLSKPKATSWRK